MIDSVQRNALKVGLKINVGPGKTEYMLIGNWPQKEQIALKLDDLIIQRVLDYKYLGSYLLNSEKDFEVRKALAWVAIKKLRMFWRSDIISRDNKIKLFQSCIETVLLYNAVTWNMNLSLTKKLDGCYSRLLRYALNIKWTAKVTNVLVFKDLPKISDRLRIRRLTFIGHCYRSGESAPQPITDVLFFKCHPELKRKRGNYSNYIRLLHTDMGPKFNDEQVLKDNISDREHWRKLIHNLPKK
jgi:hypothetical protein